MHLKPNNISVIFAGILVFCLALFSTAQQNINNITVTVTFDNPPTTYTVTKAPLKYNKTFAFSFQVDDGTYDLYNKVYPHFSNLFYTDGCGNNIAFTASSSVYCFQGLAQNGPDMHDPLDPSYDEGYLTWDNMEQLYGLNYGIYDHGVSGDASTINSFMNYSINRNRSFIRRKMYQTLHGAYSGNTFVCPNQLEQWTQPAFDNNLRLVLNDLDGGPFGYDGGDVNGAFNWNENRFIKRREAHRVVPVLPYIDNLYNKSTGGANYWGSLFTHLIPDIDNGEHYPKTQFESDFANIASVYGKGSLDNIIIATDEEIYNYLFVRDAISLVENINGNVLEISFAGSVPDNLNFYAMSLIVNADVGIQSVLVSGSDGFSKNINTGLINFHWNDKVIPDPITLADNYTVKAEESKDKYDAWIAMDYVYTLPLGNEKVALVNRLCGLSGITYEEGFCDITTDTVVKIYGDTIICQGESTVLTATANMDIYEWSTFEGSQSITVSPNVNTKYSVRGRRNNIDSFDTVTVVVNPTPNIISHSETYVNHIPGVNDTLWVSTQNPILTYLWNTGESDSAIIVDPTFTSDYFVDVSNEYACSARQNFNVKLENTFQFSFDSVCIGGTTHLHNTSTYPDSVVAVMWDLNSDGIFDDATGNAVYHKFAEVGNHLVGMRSVLYNGGLQLVFNVVPVGDFPKINFVTDNECKNYSTTFDDKSTVIVGDNIDWFWDFGDIGSDVGSFVSHTYSNVGTYDVTLIVSSTIGCKDTLIRAVEIGEIPIIVMQDKDGNTLFANDTTKITKNDSLYVTIQNADLYDSIIWNNAIYSTDFYVVNEGEFNVDVYSLTCHNSQYHIMAYDKGGITPTTNEIMNLFTPNGDGYNDAWVVNDPNLITPFSVKVYNRYGNLVYSSSNYGNDWDGNYNETDLPQATYYYIIEDADGKIFKGAVTILR